MQKARLKQRWKSKVITNKIDFNAKTYKPEKLKLYLYCIQVMLKSFLLHRLLCQCFEQIQLQKLILFIKNKLTFVYSQN